MKLTISLTNDDFWIYSERVQRGKEKKGNSIIRFFIAILPWIVVGFGIAYIRREVLHQEGSLLVSLAPFLAIFFVFIVFLKIFSYKTKKRLSPQPGGYVLGEKQYEFSDQGINEKSKTHESNYSWNCIINIVNDSDYIYIFLDTINAIIIPKRIFTNTEEPDKFYNEIKIYWENATDNSGKA